MTNNEYTLLSNIVENTDMAIHAINKLTHNKKVTNSLFLDMLDKQLAEYQEIHESACTLISASGERVKVKNSFVKSMSAFGINWEIMVDSSTSHLAQMLLQGMTMGEIGLLKELNGKRGSVPQETLDLADKLLDLHATNAENYKKYL